MGRAYVYVMHVTSAMHVITTSLPIAIGTFFPSDSTITPVVQPYAILALVIKKFN